MKEKRSKTEVIVVSDISDKQLSISRYFGSEEARARKMRALDKRS